MKPAPPGNSVGFDIQPQHVHYAAFRLRNGHYDFKDDSKSLVDTLDEYARAAGCGSGPEAFAAAYAKVAARFLEVWVKAAVGVGGAAVGLTVTANNYAAAEHAAHPTPTPVPAKQQLPDVIRSSHPYGPAAELGWGGGDAPDESRFGNVIIDGVGGAFSWVGSEVLRPVLKHALRHGKVADITPGGDDIDLPKIAEAWRTAAKDAKRAADGFDDAIAYLTNSAPAHSEWQEAMQTFCSSIWGTTAWGKESFGRKWNHRDGQRPALDVLCDTAREVGAACDKLSAAVVKVRSTITDVYCDAAKKTFEIKGFRDLLELAGGPAEYALEFIAHIDSGRLNHAVDAYNQTAHTLADNVSELKGALDEAYLSVPDFAAEEARAEAFGARSLNDFRKEHKWTDPADAQNGRFEIDLAGQEGIGNSHIIEKHVGKSDDQLLQRFRDDVKPNGKPFPGSSSSFMTLEGAQKFTQQSINVNSAEINAWLASQPDPNPGNRTLGLPVYETGDTTGRTVSKADYLTQGENAPVREVTKVKTVLRWDGSLRPPFIVYTSYPTS
ncbi:RNase A-like domain-containing protein [Streptomyces sp. NPDC051218]|uniref:RNase A-like domain-containing protein n=1 Tax=Streptomyces sp. NPDC051218 TaxID=3365645 RepID=UPI0037A5EC96